MMRGVRYIPAAAIAIGIAILSLWEDPHLPSLGAHSDKILHTLMYVVLSVACLSTQPIKRASWTTTLLSVGFTIAWGGLMEILQTYLTTTRQGDWNDELANTLGAIVGALIFWLFVYIWNKRLSTK